MSTLLMRIKLELYEIDWQQVHMRMYWQSYLI